MKSYTLYHQVTDTERIGEVRPLSRAEHDYMFPLEGKQVGGCNGHVGDRFSGLLSIIRS